MRICFWPVLFRQTTAAVAACTTAWRRRGTSQRQQHSWHGTAGCPWQWMQPLACATCTAGASSTVTVSCSWVAAACRLSCEGQQGCTSACDLQCVYLAAAMAAALPRLLQSRAPTCWWTKHGASKWQVGRPTPGLALPTTPPSCPTGCLPARLSGLAVAALLLDWQPRLLATHSDCKG